MAELDIKDIWEKGKLQQAEEVQLNVDNMEERKPKDVLYWVKFILWIEVGLNVACLPLFAWMLFSDDLRDVDRYIYSWGIGMIILYLFYYRFLISSINKFDYAGDVKGSLTKIYKYLKFYILHYKVVVWGLMPLSSFVSYFITISSPQENQPEVVIGSGPFWVGMAAVLVLSLLFSLLFNFLVNLIYGRKIKRLKEMVSQL